MLPHNDSGYLAAISTPLKKEDNWQNITYMSNTGARTWSGLPLYLGMMSKMTHKAFYSNKKLALSLNSFNIAMINIRDYYIILSNGKIIKDTCYAEKVYVSGKRWCSRAFIFENIDIQNGDVITVFSEADYTLGYYFKLKMDFNEKGESESVGYDVEHKVIEWLPYTDVNHIKEYHFD